MDIFSTIFSAISFLINELLKIANTMITSVIASFQAIMTGILNGFGIPFSTWSNYLASPQNGFGFTIPIIFVIVLGIAFLLFIAFIDIYGIENDAGNTIGILMKGLGGG